MRILTRFVLRHFLPIFLLALAFFVMIIQLVDLFGNLVRYLNLEIPLLQILRVQLLFLPRSISYALPIALLFAVAFTLGTFYSNNELIAVFGAGVPLYRFTAPIVALGILLSLGVFFFHEHLVIDTYRRKNELSRELLNITRTFSNTDITVRGPAGQVIYSAEYYNDTTQQLSRVTVVERDGEGVFQRRINASTGRWNGTNWVWENGTDYRVLNNSPREGITAEPFHRIDDDRFGLHPRSFRRVARDIDEMPLEEAREWVSALRNAGQPFRRPLTDYYNRFSFALTPFIVALLSSSMGGRFRKNILLMSLLVSLVVTVVYYVTGMITGLMAGNGLIPPIAGAWTGVVVFTVLGVVLFRTAKT